VIDFDTDWVKLEWDKPEFDGGSTITGYIIEKRDKQFQVSITQNSIFFVIHPPAK
jgi:hypothetical protein